MSTERLKIPSRYENLIMQTSDALLPRFIHEVRPTLRAIDDIHDDMQGANQGAFLVLHGAPGSGKTTFLHTLKLFRPVARTLDLDAEQPFREALEDLPESSAGLRVVVLKGRDSPDTTRAEDVENMLHAINDFIRSPAGRSSLVVWPCTSDGHRRRLLETAARIGGDALLGVHPEGLPFAGPDRAAFVTIANQTVEALNGGATLTSLGVTEERCEEIAREAPTIGAFMKALRDEERRLRNALQGLAAERGRFDLWVVVIAGNDPEMEVGTLTSGTNFRADVEKMLRLTSANVVQDLRRYPEKIGLLGSFFDAKVVYVPMMTAVAVVRDFADEEAARGLDLAGFKVVRDGTGARRLGESQLARAFRQEGVEMRRPGAKPGDASVAEFGKLTAFAKGDDGALNRCFGAALLQLGLVRSIVPEAPVGASQRRSADLHCETATTSVRLEFMWRAQTGVGDIAKYALEKLYNYGRSIGFLNGQH